MGSEWILISRRFKTLPPKKMADAFGFGTDPKKGPVCTIFRKRKNLGEFQQAFFSGAIFGGWE